MDIDTAVDSVILQVRIISSPVRSPTCARRGYFVAAEVALEDAPSLVRSKERAQASSSRTAVGRSWRAIRPSASCSRIARAHVSAK